MGEEPFLYQHLKKMQLTPSIQFVSHNGYLFSITTPISPNTRTHIHTCWSYLSRLADKSRCPDESKQRDVTVFWWLDNPSKLRPPASNSHTRTHWPPQETHMLPEGNIRAPSTGDSWQNCKTAEEGRLVSHSLTVWSYEEVNRISLLTGLAATPRI